jgi:hypothetical protein
MENLERIVRLEIKMEEVVRVLNALSKEKENK